MATGPYKIICSKMHQKQNPSRKIDASERSIDHARVYTLIA